MNSRILFAVLCEAFWKCCEIRLKTLRAIYTKHWAISWTFWRLINIFMNMCAILTQIFTNIHKIHATGTHNFEHFILLSSWKYFFLMNLLSIPCSCLIIKLSRKKRNCLDLNSWPLVLKLESLPLCYKCYNWNIHQVLSHFLGDFLYWISSKMVYKLLENVFDNWCKMCMKIYIVIATVVNNIFSWW